jgi:FkbM family methyltransferase
MDLDEMKRRNAAALDQIWSGLSDETKKDTYFGFLVVDGYECPPFVMFSANDVAAHIDGNYEPQSMKTWCRLASLATGILDVGANAGLYALSAAALRPDLKIHAFEPNPYAFARLRLNKTLNGFWHITENRYAISNQEGVIQLFWVKKASLQIASGASIMQKDDPTKQDQAVAEARRLDSFPEATMLGIRGLMKIDVEGAEKGVFNGMPGVLAQRPDIILETFSRSACEAINGLVLPLGYHVYLIDEVAHEIVARERLEPADFKGLNYNQLLTVRPDSEIRALLAD